MSMKEDKQKIEIEKLWNIVEFLFPYAKECMYKIHGKEFLSDAQVYNRFKSVEHSIEYQSKIKGMSLSEQENERIKLELATKINIKQ